MQKNLKLEIFKPLIAFSDEKEKVAKINKKIYQEREGSHSWGGFGCERARKVNFRVISKIFETI